MPQANLLKGVAVLCPMYYLLCDLVSHMWPGTLSAADSGLLAPTGSHFKKKTYNPPTHTLARSLTFPSFYFLDCFPSCTLWLHCSCISPSIQSDGKQMLIQQLFKYSDTIKATITCEGWVVTYSVLWQERNIFLAREFTRELKTSPIFWFWRRVGKDFIWLSCFLSLLISQP